MKAAGPDGTVLPIVSTQTAYTQVRVPDGDTIVIGGLVRRAESPTPTETAPPETAAEESEEAQAAARGDTELLIFVTPRIIREVPRE